LQHGWNNKKGYKMNEKLGRKIAQWMKNWKVEFVQKIKQWEIGNDSFTLGGHLI